MLIIIIKRIYNLNEYFIDVGNYLKIDILVNYMKYCVKIVFEC